MTSSSFLKVAWLSCYSLDNAAFSACDWRLYCGIILREKSKECWPYDYETKLVCGSKINSDLFPRYIFVSSQWYLFLTHYLFSPVSQSLFLTPWYVLTLVITSISQRVVNHCLGWASKEPWWDCLFCGLQSKNSVATSFIDVTDVCMSNDVSKCLIARILKTYSTWSAHSLGASKTSVLWEERFFFNSLKKHVFKLDQCRKLPDLWSVISETRQT